MNRRECVWAISHDIIEMFSKDFGPFKRTAEDIMYKKIMEKSDADIKAALQKITARLAAIDE